MIAEIYYYTSSELNAKDMKLEVGKTIDLVVPKRGKLIYQLNKEDNLLFHILKTPHSTVEEIDKNTVMVKDAFIQSSQLLTTSVMQNILDLTKEDPTTRNGFLLDWAFDHCFRSTIIHYMSKYPSMRKHLDRLIYDNINNFEVTNILIHMINRYDYDIHKNNDRLLTQAAMSKNITLCEYLIEERDCLIPPNIFKIYKTHGSKRFPLMWELLSKHADKVDWR